MTDTDPLLDPTGRFILRSPRTAAEMRRAAEVADRPTPLAELRQQVADLTERVQQLEARHAREDEWRAEQLEREG